MPVFNAPGANANAVKELVLASLFLAARNIVQAWDFARSLEGDDETIDKAVEAGKKKFVGLRDSGAHARRDRARRHRRGSGELRASRWA